MFSAELLSTFKSKIDNAKTVAIFGHESVDGDAVGCMLGLGTVCEKLGKKVGYFTALAPGRSYQFLADIGKIRTDFDYSDNRDLIIFVDFTGYHRIGKITSGHEEYFDSKPKLIVDHHMGDETPANAALLKDIDSASCCELIYDILKVNRPEIIDSTIATYLYLGLTTDTGNFQYETDSIKVFQTAIDLIQHGANKPWIVQNIFNGSDRSTIDLLKMIMPRIAHEGNVCYAWYTSEEIEKLGFDKDEADNIILNNLRPIRGVGVIAIIRKGTDGRVGMSFRSGFLDNGKRINVQAIAVHFGGGGHMYAAGCKTALEEDFVSQVPKIVQQINEQAAKQL